MFQIALVLDHLWNQISKCCWIFPLLASTLCPVWKSLLPVVNYTINDTEEINSIWPLPPGVTRLMSRLSDHSPDKCDIRRLRRSQVQSRGRQETLDICADLSQHRTYPQSDSPAWPFICPRELGDPCYDNIIPRPCTCLDSSLGRGARSRCSGQAAAWYLNLIQEIQQRINKA